MLMLLSKIQGLEAAIDQLSGVPSVVRREIFA
jgi:hypothetical protein